MNRSAHSISLRTTVTLTINKKIWGGAKKVHYKRCANEECCFRKARSAILDKSP